MHSTQFSMWYAVSGRLLGPGLSGARTISLGLLAILLRLISILPFSPTKIAPRPGPRSPSRWSFNSVPLANFMVTLARGPLSLRHAMIVRAGVFLADQAARPRLRSELAGGHHLDRLFQQDFDGPVSSVPRARLIWS